MEIFRNNKGKVAGWLNNRIYYKVVNSKRHKMKIYNAYGIDADILVKLVGKCDLIRLKESDTGRIYETTFDVFTSNRSKVSNFDGEQRFLPLNLWTLEDQTKKLF